jgi:hypothetical protein
MEKDLSDAVKVYGIETVKKELLPLLRNVLQ